MGSGSQTQKTEIPAWLENASRSNIAMGNDVAGLGYVPYYGPDVAAFTPMQQAAFQNTGQAANAFGVAGGGLMGMEGMPQPQQFAGGVSGYSSAPLFSETMAALEANNPGQFAAIQNMFINPQTGAGGNSYAIPVAAPAAAMARPMQSGGYNGDPNQAANDRALDFSRAADRYGGATRSGNAGDGNRGGGGFGSALGNFFGGDY